jgi:cellulose synthase operon protein C
MEHPLMRKLNVKLFLVLVIGAVAVAGSVWGLHTFQYKRIAAALLWQARRAEEVGKIDQMARYLERYLEFAPQDTEEQAHLGRTLAGDYFAASLPARRQSFFVLNKVLARDSNRPDVQRLLVKVALEIGEYSTARQNLESLAKNSSTGGGAADRGELEGYWGRLLDAEKKPVEAVNYCRRAVKDAPAVEENYTRLAYLLRAQQDVPLEQRDKNRAEADQTINDLAANNPTSSKAHLARWRYRREFDLLDLRGTKEPGKIAVEKAAAEDVDVALSQAPEDVDVLVAKADSEVILQHRDKAYEYLQQGVKLQTTQGYRGSSDQAEFNLLWHLATLLLSDAKLSNDENKMAEVEQVIARIRKTRGQPAAADYLEGWLLVHKKEWARAAALLERTRPALAAQQAHRDLIGQIDLYLGQCFEALEEPAQAAAAFQRALEWDKNLPQAHLGLGQAQRHLGRVDDALANLRKAAETSSDGGKTWLEVARLEVLHQLQQDNHDWTAANEAIDHAAATIAKDAKESVQPALLRAEILAIQDKVDLAEKLLTDAKTAHPERVEFWTALADLAGRRKQEPKALEILDEAEKTLHDCVELRVSRALHLAADPTKENLAALDILAKKDRSSFNAEDQEKLLSGLSGAQMRAGQPAEATTMLEELARTPGHRNDLRLRLTLFDLAVKRDDGQAVDKVLAEVREVEGGAGAFYGLGQALRLLYLARKNPKEAKDDLDEAWRALDRAANLQPNWAALELARADVAELSGDPEGAILHLKAAVHLEQGRVSASVVQRLVEALYQRQRYAEAEVYLGQLKQSLLVDSPLGRLAAGVRLSLNLDHPEKAQGAVDAAVREGTKDFRDLLLRARFHEAMHQDGAAEADYRKATEVAPEQAAVWVALVQYLGNHEKSGTAASLIKSDVAVKVAKDRVDLAVAQCYEVLALGKEAGAAYDAAVNAKPNDPTVARAVAAYRLRTGRVREATPLLEKLANRELKGTSEADLDWARRGLAMVLSSSTDYRDFRRALELVGLNLDENGLLLPEPPTNRDPSVEVRRARARVLATQPQRQFRVKAAQLLESLQPSDADDWYVLALLYDADNAEAKEVALLKQLANLDDRVIKPSFLVQYSQFLIRQGKSDKAKLDEVAPIVERLEKLEKDRGQANGAFGTVELRARLLEARGQGDKALDLLRGYVNRRGAKPEEVLMLVSSLGRQRRFSEALDLCEKERVWEKCPPQVAGGICMSLLHGTTNRDEKLNRVESWLKTAIEKNPKLVVLKMQLADLYDLSGDYVSAQKQYRAVLDAEPGNVVALNNLAWLLSDKTGQGREALKYAEAAVNGMGRRADLLDTRGLVQLNLGNNEAALADFTEASNDSPTAARLFHLARAQYKARDRDAAMRTLRKARSDFGLEPAGLHPTEQEVCQTLMNELKVR